MGTRKWRLGNRLIGIRTKKNEFHFIEIRFFKIQNLK